MDKIQKDPNNWERKLFFPFKNRDGNQVLSLLKQKLLVYTSVSIFCPSSICFNSHLKKWTNIGLWDMNIPTNFKINQRKRALWHENGT